jgi:predicted GIY-YIG superfamily endonuclease
VVSKEACQIEALKYNTKKDFLKKSKCLYRKSYKNGWLDDICSHMTPQRKPKNYWTKEKCKEELYKFNSFKELKTKNETVYNIILKNKWFDICDYEYVERIWKIENIFIEIKKHETLEEFRNNCYGGYQACIKNGWLDEIKKHLIHKKSWTREMCHEKALLCSTKSEFQHSYPSAYCKAHKNGWLDEICTHMKKIGNYKKRCIYVWEFEDMSAYVGLTYSLDNRTERHINDNKSSVNKHLIICSGTCKQLTEYIDVDEAIKKESYYINLYRDSGWFVLNKVKAGSIGGNKIIWNENNFNILFKNIKYNKNILRNHYKGAYSAALKNNWI